MMKKIFAFWVAISLVLYMVFEVTLSADQYLERLKDLPSFRDLFLDLVNSFKNIGLYFTEITDLVSFFKAFGSIFVAIFRILELPVKFVGFVINVIMTFVPIGVGG